jgi:putative ABC transport system permease protein
VLIGLAWRNIWRQPYRTALSLASISLAAAVTVFLLALQQGAYGTIKENVLRLSDGFAQIQPPSYNDDPSLRKTIPDPAALLARLDELPKITASAPRASTYVILSNGPKSYGGAVFGVDASRERAMSSLGSSIVKGRFLTPDDRDAIVIGAALARNLNVDIAGQLTLLGGARDGSVAADVLRVVGIFATGVPQLDREVAEIPLLRFQADFALDERVNFIAVAGRTLNDIQGSLPELRRLAGREDLQVRDWTELEPSLHEAILLDVSISLLWYVSVVVVVVFIILNTLLMSVLERTREFGMLLAIGMRAGQVGRMIWLELFFLAGSGTALGIALGSAVTAWTAWHGIPFSGAEALFSQWHMPATLFPQLSLTSALAGPLAIAAAIAVAGVVPYLHVRRFKPVTAMTAP